MLDTQKERFPEYTPFYYRLFVKARKICRQTKVRIAEFKARQHMPKQITPDGPATWSPRNKDVPNPQNAINKSAVWIEQDLSVPEISNLIGEFEKLKILLNDKGLKYTNTAGTFLSRMFYPRSERSKLWENAWAIQHSGVQKGHKVLDIGGASTYFCFYLGKLGCSVSIVDNDWGNCGTLYNTRYVAKKMGWDIKILDMDIARPLPFTDNAFDRVFSICTIEHLTSSVRRSMMKEIGRVLKPGGIAAITMSYDRQLNELLTDKGLRFGYREKLESDLIKPSGLYIYGNTDLIDAFPENNFLGALFLTKKT